MITQKELIICYKRLRDWGYFTLSSGEQTKIILMYMYFLEYEKEKKEVIAKFIDKMGISEDELISILIFREVWITLSDSLKDIMKKLVHWEITPHFVTCIKDEENEDIDEE